MFGASPRDVIRWAVLAACVTAPQTVLADARDDEAAILAFHDQAADARALLERAARAGSRNARVFLYLGLDSRTKGDYAEATAFLERGLKDSGELEKTLLIELAVTASWDGRLADAQRRYEEVTTRWPDDVTAQVGRARMLSWRGRHRAARRALQAVVAEHPENLEAWTTLGAAQAADNRTSAARTAYLRALELEPENATASRGLEQLAAQHRFRMSVFGGYVNVAGAQHAGLAEAEFAFDVRSFVTVLGAYNTSVFRFDDPTTSNHLGHQHVGSAGAVFNVRRRVYLGAEFRALAVRDDLHASGTLALALVATPNLTLSGSARPGAWVSGGRDLLTRASVEGRIGRRIFPSIHWYAYRDFPSTFASDALVGKVRVDVVKPLALTLGGGWSYGQGTHGSVGLGQVDVRLAEHVGVFARYELSTGLMTRHAAGAGLRFQW